MNNILIEKIEKKFSEQFGTTPSLIKAPGRINLIGEHTDYNDGFVLPAAIDKAIYFAAAKNDVNKLRLFSVDFDSSFEIDIDKLAKTDTQWANYLIGTAFQIASKGHKFGGIDCVFGGDIPLGAGLSSSAALECGFAYTISELYDLKIERSDLIFLAQKAEHDFAGVKCGIMDQFASTFGKEGHVMKLDCRSMDFDYYPLDNQNYEVVLINTNVTHNLASSEYNTRRMECEAGVAAIQKINPSVKSLRDANLNELEQVKGDISEKEYDRCSYVIGEIERVENACQELLKGNFDAFGKMMFETHDGLSIKYEVSCKELDMLVDVARDAKEVIGCRLMGGGFGGCTINLIKKDDANGFVNKAVESFEKEFGKKPEVYRVKVSDGVSKIK
ncbi:MAG: galactokinase [Bacteroidales bacterium]|nr:galactokinase [Bacteroidales bacterium]